MQTGRGEAVVRRVIGVALMVDGAWTALWFTSLLSGMAGRGADVIVVMVGRLAVGMLAVIAGWLVSQRRPPGERLAAVAAIVTAVVAGAGLWLRLLPNNLDPAWRLPVAVLYLMAAAVIVVWARHRMHGDADQ